MLPQILKQRRAETAMKLRQGPILVHADDWLSFKKELQLQGFAAPKLVSRARSLVKKWRVPAQQWRALLGSAARMWTLNGSRSIHIISFLFISMFQAGVLAMAL